MTAVTETSVILREAAVIDRGWDTWRQAMNTEWPETNRREVGATVYNLRESLDLYACILSEVIHPASEWPDLEYEDDAYVIAMERATSDVAEWTEELIRVLPAAGEGGEK